MTGIISAMQMDIKAFLFIYAKINEKPPPKSDGFPKVLAGQKEIVIP